MIEGAYTSYLTGSAGLTGIVGDNIHWLKRPAWKDLPGVTLQKINERRLVGSQMGLSETIIQVDCWATTYAVMKSIGNAIVMLCNGVAMTIETTEFQGMFIDADEDGLEGESPEQFFRNRLDVRIWHRESS